MPKTNTSQKSFKPSLLALALLAPLGLVGLTGCGDDDGNTFSDFDGTPSVDAQTYSDAKLLQEPTVTKTLSRAELAEAIDAAGLTSAVPDPVCGVTVQYIDHSTTGLKGETTNATGAVMTPVSDGATNEDCAGERPVMLYAHGTTVAKNYNLAALNDANNPAYGTALLVAATFTGQGDIVIAPNFPGYDTSELDYVPYITKQQGTQMLDGLQAGLDAIAKDSDVQASDKLFVTGYSQGGYVAMATAQALDEIGKPATAVSPAAGPYAVAAFADSIMSGKGIIGGTGFLPLMTGSYDAEYDNISEGAYNPKYGNPSTLFPTDKGLNDILGNDIPTLALFEVNPDPVAYPDLQNISPPTPMDAWYFAEEDYLFNTAFRADYVSDMLANPDGIYPEFNASNPNVATSNFKVRQVFIDNDLRDYEPKSPMLLCGGHGDPTVTFDVNTYAQARIWQDKGIPFALVDLDTNNSTERMNNGYQNYISTLPTDITLQIESSLMAEQTAFSEVSDSLGFLNYHGGAMPYCLRAADVFFEAYR